MVQCLIGLGSNLNDRDGALRTAWQAISQLPETRAIRLSRYFSTQPAGGPTGQELFSNAVGVAETSLSPEALLRELLATELALGRERKVRWGPRAIDLDLLLYGDAILQTPSLTLPHPRMAFRRFVLEPAAEVAPEFVYPVNGWTIARLLEYLDKTKRVIAIDAVDSQLRDQALDEIVRRCEAVVLRPENVLPADGADFAGDRWALLAGWHEQSTDSAGPLQPKLVVLIDAPDASQPAAHQLRIEWRQRIGAGHVGPVLWLKTSDASEIADEVVAAMAAMQ